MARRAQAAGLVAIALTDHDSTEGVDAASAVGDALGLRVVAGCEFSVKAPWGELHVLGYFIQPGHPQLEAFLRETRAARRRRAEQIVARLQNLGLPIEFGDVMTQAESELGGGGGGALGRPHVARALVQRGASADVSEAFAHYLGRGRPAFVEKPLPSLEQVTTLIRQVGGVAVAAHLGERGSAAQVRRFQEQGLDGLEVRHPSHSPVTEARLTRLAERLGLVITGGSDWHGDTEFGGGDAHAPLGGLRVPAAWLVALERVRERFL